MRMTGIILSGGKSVRMGRNKAFIPVNGEKIIDRTIRIFSDIFDEIILVTNSPLEYLDYDLKIVTDLIKGKSALGGIYTGLFHAAYDNAFVAACDMPFLNGAFIKYMTENTGSNDIVVPSPPDGLQPLHAIYSKRCIPHIKNLIEKDKLKIAGFYKKSKTLLIPPDVLHTFDPEGRMFLNVNTREDIDKL
jgi:molybdopterin-guanine dinucleotide biosynthesis protein A